MKKRIEFGELRIGGIAKAHMDECLKSNHITMGPKCELLEKEWKKLFGYKNLRLVNSGTSAGTAACMALYPWLNIKPNPDNEIIVPALSFIATSNAVRLAGFKPRFVDVDWDLNINASLIKQNLIPGNTVAVKIVNTMGVPCDIKKIKEVMWQYDLSTKWNVEDVITPLIIDNCEAYSCQYDGKYMLEYADMETASNYVAHLVCSAEQGWIATKNEKLDKIIESIRTHGRTNGSLYFDHQYFGGNFKPTDLHACIGIEGVMDFWENWHKRKSNYYAIADVTEEFKDHAYFTEEKPNTVNAPHGFSIVLKPHLKQYFTVLTDRLDQASIHWKRNFGCIPTQHKAFEYMGHKLGEFPVAEYIGDYGLHIGIHQYLSFDDVNYVIDTLRKFFKDYS